MRPAGRVFETPGLTVAWVSQPSSSVAGEIRISQEPQIYQVLFRWSWQKWRGLPTSGGEHDPTILNKVQVTFLPTFFSRVWRRLVYTIEKITSVIKYILTIIPVSCIWQLHHSQYRLHKLSHSKYIQPKF